VDRFGLIGVLLDEQVEGPLGVSAPAEIGEQHAAQKLPVQLVRLAGQVLLELAQGVRRAPSVGKRFDPVQVGGRGGAGGQRGDEECHRQGRLGSRYPPHASCLEHRLQVPWMARTRHSQTPSKTHQIQGRRFELCETNRNVSMSKQSCYESRMAGGGRC
jgi:hypothetical protein